MSAGLTRTLKLGDRGMDVEAAKRTVYRYLQVPGRLRELMRKPLVVRRTFGPFFRTVVKYAAGQAGLPMYGVIGPNLWAAMEKARAVDAYSRSLLLAYAESQKPKLVEPLQGFHSLHQSLWEAYSVGRNMGLFDLGTFNSASRLPSGAPSDHAVYPAYAFDLGFDPDTGYQHPVARKFADQMIGRREIGYWLLGDKAWSHRQGLHPFYGGGHANHIHCSGVR